MKPISYTKKGEVTTFHYKPSELINFVREGHKTGNVGMIVIRRDGGMITYKGFGTLENPRRHIMTISLMHHPSFDGYMISDEQRIKS